VEGRLWMEGVEVLYTMEEGYRPQVHFETWRVAILRYADRFNRANLNRLERHHLTDEVFVLLEGEATLIIGERCEECPMEMNRIYNVRKDVWHHIIVSRDTRVLIVENDNTGLENTEYLPL
jgi:mannose-6-phosphate isomerase-like protein (cupin superfamily)